MIRDLGDHGLCEGVETVAEYELLRDMGCHLMQGYLFAKPALEAVPSPHGLVKRYGSRRQVERLPLISRHLPTAAFRPIV